MELFFLGTSAGTPTRERNVSSYALRREDGQIWLFDCGEATQHQLLRSPLRPGAIERLCITHLHGDHCYGIFGFLASLAVHGRKQRPFSIIGPQGIKEMVESVLRLSHLRLPFPLHFMELRGDGADCDDKDGWRLQMRPLHHRIPCFGYVIDEPQQPGRLDAAKVSELGLGHSPLRGCLVRGETVTLDNGRVITPDQVVGPKRLGRRLVVLGDTQDSQAIHQAGQGCDVLLHEATFANSLEAKARQWGHSTAGMAGACAQAMQAKHLVLTHFSARYGGSDPDTPDDSTAGGPVAIEQLVAEAAAACPQTTVHAAADLHCAHLQRHRQPGDHPALDWSLVSPPEQA